MEIRVVKTQRTGAPAASTAARPTITMDQPSTSSAQPPAPVVREEHLYEWMHKCCACGQLLWKTDDHRTRLSLQRPATMLTCLHVICNECSQRYFRQPGQSASSRALHAHVMCADQHYLTCYLCSVKTATNKFAVFNSPVGRHLAPTSLTCQAGACPELAARSQQSICKLDAS
jgi:hypothetical protein